jgi:hypothetical protein
MFREFKLGIQRTVGGLGVQPLGDRPLAIVVAAAEGGDEDAVKAMKGLEEVRNCAETGSHAASEPKALYSGLSPCVKKFVEIRKHDSRVTRIDESQPG